MQHNSCTEIIVVMRIYKWRVSSRANGSDHAEHIRTSASDLRSDLTRLTGEPAILPPSEVGTRESCSADFVNLVHLGTSMVGITSRESPTSSPAHATVVLSQLHKIRCSENWQGFRKCSLHHSLCLAQSGRQPHEMLWKIASTDPKSQSLKCKIWVWSSVIPDSSHLASSFASS